MTLLEISGLIGAAAIGISLGLIGGGGSILTVPVLVYLMGIEPVLATAYSLFIVGATALIGGINYSAKGLVSYKTGIVFTIPAFIGVYLTRLLFIPVLPETWLTLNGFVVTKNTGILLIFAFLMVFASISMIRKNRKNIIEETDAVPSFNLPVIMAVALVVGVLTGFVGAGGGFLIIPALVIFANLPMKTAIGTSLLIIAAKSLVGFLGDIQAGEMINWWFLGMFSGIAVVGIFVGSHFAHAAEGARLKSGFGWFVLAMGGFMIMKELFLLKHL